MMPQLTSPARLHELSFRQSPIRCLACGQEVTTMTVWLEQACGGRSVKHPAAEEEEPRAHGRHEESARGDRCGDRDLPSPH